MAVEQQVSREELIDRAKAMLPAIRSRAHETEKLRRIPDSTISELQASGLMRICTPPRFGGYSHDIDLMWEIAMEVGRACGSTGWCFAVMSIHNWMVGHWPLQAQEDYFSTGPDTLSSSAFAPTGKLERVEGGYRMSGRWDFSSGSDAGSWALLSAMGPEGPRMAILPRSDYEIIDTWYVSGLRGTGSKDIAVDNVFVPEHRVGMVMDLVQGTSAYDLHGRASYRLHPYAFLPYTLCSPLVGMAQGAIDEFTRRLEGKTGPGRTSESVAVQLRLAESSAEVDAARMIVLTSTRGLIEKGARGEEQTELEAATNRRNYTYVAKLCVQSVNRLFDASGGHALYESEAMQRFHRDVHAGSHQIALGWDSAAEGYGRAALGLPPPPGFF